MVIQRFSVWRVNLNPTQGSEQAGSTPALVVSPDPMNEKLKTVIIAPMTTRLRGWPSRVLINHDNNTGEVALDHFAPSTNLDWEALWATWILHIMIRYCPSWQKYLYYIS